MNITPTGLTTRSSEQRLAAGLFCILRLASPASVAELEFVRPRNVARHMQELLGTLLSDLHALYFKPSGFKKQRQRFSRLVGSVMQEVGFQSSQWNATGQPITFYVNVCCGFADIPLRDGKAALSGTGRLGGLAAGAPAEFHLTSASYAAIRAQLLHHLPIAISALPDHYEVVRTRAQQGYFTPIPLPDTWQA